MSCSRTQCSVLGEAQTHNRSVSSQALYHQAIVAPYISYQPFCLERGLNHVWKGVGALGSYWHTLGSLYLNQMEECISTQKGKLCWKPFVILLIKWLCIYGIDGHMIYVKYKVSFHI